jgi:DNA-binding transcriptional LysR family regulator
MNVAPRQLRIFLSLAQSLNFSRTAEQFHMTQPSLSKIVKELEETLGLALFERSTRSVLLTPEGTALVPLARRVVDDYDSGLAAMQRLLASEARKVDIAALPSLATVLLPEAVQALEQDWPGVAVTVFDGSSEATLKRVLTRQVDFALASADPSKPELLYEEILRDRFVLLSAGALSKRLGPVARLDDLVDLPLISMTDASTAKKYMIAAFMARDAEFRPKMQFDQAVTIGGFVRQGVGIAVMPYLGIQPLLAGGGFCVTEIEDAPQRSIGIVTRRAEALTEVSTRAIAHVRAAAAQVVAREPRWLVLPQGLQMRADIR